MRVLFAGSPAIAVPSLRAISALEMEGRGICLIGILTNPDNSRGRKLMLMPTDVSAAACELDAERAEKDLSPIKQFKPDKLDAITRKDVAALSPDLLVSFAYGRIFGPRFLSLFPYGGINIHPSLLPKYRGASPIPSAIIAGEKETGICIQKLALGMDTGDIISREVFPLSLMETTLSLSETVSHRAAYLLKDLLPAFTSKAAMARPQSGEATYCYQIKKENGIIDWSKSAEEIDACIRAYTPWPLCFTCLGNQTLFILEAMPLINPEEIQALNVREKSPGTVLGMDSKLGILIQAGKGILAVSRLQWQAKKALGWKDFCNGTRDFTGSRLG